jgi:hypothetical protein
MTIGLEGRVYVPRAYSISMAEFRKVPRRLRPYSPGDRVTRANFSSWVIDNFRFSAGSFNLAILHGLWCQANTGFSYVTTLDNLIYVGTGVFSSAEQDMLWEAYKETSPHAGRLNDFGPTTIGRAILDQFEETSYELVTDHIRPFKTRSELEGKTWKELLQFRREYLGAKKRARASSSNL